MTWSFYNLDDGFFTGSTFSGSEEALAMNVPDGCGYVEGSYDHMSKRVDLDTDEVIDWQPAAPADTETETYGWNTTVKRWIATKTLEGNRVPLRAVVQDAFERVERTQNRAVREMLLNGVGTSAYTSAKNALEVADTKAAQLRTKLNAINSAAAEAALPSEEDITDIA